MNFTTLLFSLLFFLHVSFALPVEQAGSGSQSHSSHPGPSRVPIHNRLDSTLPGETRPDRAPHPRHPPVGHESRPPPGLTLDLPQHSSSGLYEGCTVMTSTHEVRLLLKDLKDKGYWAVEIPVTDPEVADVWDAIFDLHAKFSSRKPLLGHMMLGKVMLLKGTPRISPRLVASFLEHLPVPLYPHKMLS